jgi:magnesium transporter
MRERIEELIRQNKYTDLKELLVTINIADIAELIEELPEAELVKVFRLLPKAIAADVFSYLPTDVEQMIITSLTEKEAVSIIDDLAADDATDLCDEMPASVVKKLLAKAEPETRRDINHLLKYPDDSAGSIMTVEFVDLKENLTVGEAVQRIKKIGIDKETINVCYVLDESRRLIGTVAIRFLLLKDENELIGDIMHKNVVMVNTLTDQEEVAQIIQKYDFTTVPVVDNEQRLVGIITVDDIVDILEQEATEDIEKMAAIMPTEEPYMKTSVFVQWKKRIPWLLVLMISASFTQAVINTYQDAIIAAGYSVMTSFIPMLMDTGGNSGSQASVSVIRAITLNEIQFKDMFKVVWKESRVALLCGLTLAVCNFFKLIIIDGAQVSVSLTVCLTLIVTVFVAKVVGAVLPIVAKKLGFDPTVMASPLITTVVDVLSLMIFFNIANIVLGI